MRYIQSFSTSGTEQEAIDNNLLGKPYVALIHDGHYIDWNSNEPTPPVPPEPVYSAMPLTFEIISGGTITWEKTGDAPVKTIQYSLNDGEWITIISNTGSEAPFIEVVSGDKIQFRGDNTVYTSGNIWAPTRFNHFYVDGIFNICGNFASLISSSNYTGVTEFASYGFICMFSGNTGLLSAENLVLGDINTDVGIVSFNYFFADCTNLSKIKCMFSPGNVNSKTQYWTNNVSPTGTFVKHPNATWPSGVNGIPEGWTVIDADI